MYFWRYNIKNSNLYNKNEIKKWKEVVCLVKNDFDKSTPFTDKTTTISYIE